MNWTELSENPWFINICSGIVVAGGAFIVGYLYGKFRERKRIKGNHLHKFSFYPIKLDSDKKPFLDKGSFMEGVHYFLNSKKEEDKLAAKELLYLGEENDIPNILESDRLQWYKDLEKKFEGDKISYNTNMILENFGKLIEGLSKHLEGLGFELVLHNLQNPLKSIVAISTPSITGRKIGEGTTSLGVEITRKYSNNGESKVNYNAQFNKRNFKCTTIPLFEDNIGLIGAVCCNVDINYIKEIQKSPQKTNDFFERLIKTDQVYHENILSKEEFEESKKGKKYWNHEPPYD